MRLNETEIRIREFNDVINEIHFESRITLLVWCHAGVSQMIKVNVLVSFPERVRKPMINQPGSRLDRLSFFGYKSNDMNARDSIVIVCRQTCDNFAIISTDPVIHMRLIISSQGSMVSNKS